MKWILAAALWTVLSWATLPGVAQVEPCENEAPALAALAEVSANPCGLHGAATPGKVEPEFNNGVLAAALRDVNAFAGREVVSRGAIEGLEANPDDVRRYRQKFGEFVSDMRELEAKYARLANDRSSEEFQKEFGTLDRNLADAGIAPIEFFRWARYGGPIMTATRLYTGGAPEDLARMQQLYDLVETVSDSTLEARIATVFNRLDITSDERDALYEQAHLDAVQALRDTLNSMYERCELTDAQWWEAYTYGVRRLAWVRAEEVVGGFPSQLTLELGSEEWEQYLTRIAGPNRCNQTIDVFADPGEYEDRLIRTIDNAGPVLGITLMRIEPDRYTLGITDALSATPGNRRHSTSSSQSIVNRIVAKKLEMDLDAYDRLRERMSAAEIRDLAIAQRLIANENPDTSPPEITSTQVVARAQTLGGTSEKQQMVRDLFTHTDVRLIRNGKDLDMRLAGEIANLVTTAMDPVGKLTSQLIPTKGGLIQDGVYVGGVALNDSEPNRQVRERLAQPLLWAENTTHFVAHPRRSIEGPGRDLIDVGVPVVDEMKIFHLWKGWLPYLTWPRGFMHEKVWFSVDDEGRGRFITSGNNLGQKHFPERQEDGSLRYRWHDMGVYVEGGGEQDGCTSLVTDVANHFIKHYNQVADEARRVSAADTADWLPTAQDVGTQSGRIVSIEPGEQRNFATVTRASMANSNKYVFVHMTFFSGSGFLQQLQQLAKRWKLEGWDPNCEWDPTDPSDPGWDDPSCRRITVVIPGWLDSGKAQFASWQPTELLDHGIDVRRWRPEYGTTVTPDGRAVYDREAMTHAKFMVTLDEPAGGSGECKGTFLGGSGNFMNPAHAGTHRDLDVFSSDCEVLAQSMDELVEEDLDNSVKAKPVGFLARVLNRSIGFLSSPFQ